MFLSVRLPRRRVLCAGGLLAAVALTAGLMLGLPRVARAEKPVAESGVAVPIVMYHGFSKTRSRQGPYVLSPAVLEDDLRYLRENGYTTVVMADLIAYVDAGTPLPDRPVMLTFDDGGYSNYVYAYPLLEKYDSRMVLSPIASAVDEYTQNGNRNPDYATCSWQTLSEMVHSGRVEIQNHSYRLHNLKPRRGAAKASGESEETYRRILMDDLSLAQQRTLDELGVKPTTFTYPFGSVSPESLPILKQMGFRATLICESHVNRITRDPACLYGLGRYRRTQESAATFFSRFLPAD